MDRFADERKSFDMKSISKYGNLRKKRRLGFCPKPRQERVLSVTAAPIQYCLNPTLWAAALNARKGEGRGCFFGILKLSPLEKRDEVSLA